MYRLIICWGVRIIPIPQDEFQTNRVPEFRHAVLLYGCFGFDGQLAGFIQLVHLFCCKSSLRHRGSCFREAVVQVLIVADADGVSNFVPVVIGIQAVAAQGLLGVVQPSVTAGEGEAVQIVNQVAFAYHVDVLEIHQHTDLNIRIQQIGSIHNFLPHLLPLPAEPVGDMGEFGFAFQSFQLADGGQLIFLATLAAGQVDAPAFHVAFRTAMGAFVEDALQAVCPEIIVDLDALFCLPLEVVKAEGFIQTVTELFDTERPNLLPGEQAPSLGADWDTFAHLQLVVQGIAGERTEGLDHDDRHIEFFQQNAHFAGQGGAGTVEGVAGLVVHEDAGFQRFQRVGHIRDQTKIRNEFLGREAADGAHQPAHEAAHAHKSIGGTDDAEMLGEQDAVGDLHIQEAGVVHQDQAGLVFEFIQSLGLVFELGAHHAEHGQQANEAAPEDVGLFGIFVLVPGEGHDLVIVHMLDAGLHRGTSFLFIVCSSLYRKTARMSTEDNGEELVCDV